MARLRSQPATGVVSPVASNVNSRLTHTRASDRATVARFIGAPGRPNSTGITTVKPVATTSSANATTSGVMPGISWMTMTPGPVPLR